MKKMKLLMGIAALCALTAAVVVFASPYAPVVGACRDIEEIWALEDTRQESETPLVLRLENNGVPLVYNEEENTFYCTLGLENGESWPELHLTVPDAKGAQVCFVDDYTYDFCSDAISEGYTYELFAYTETEYSYFYVMFTGLPIVTIDTAQEVTREYTPVEAAVSAYGADGAIGGSALAHLRGGASLQWQNKKGYKLKFTRGDGSTRTNIVTLPALGQTSECILLPMAFDDTMMRDRLSWELYGRVMPLEESFETRPCTYVEVFVDGQYEGVYLMMKPYEIDEELARISSSAPLTDAVYRTAAIEFAEGRTIVQDNIRPQTGYELYYEPEAGHEFEQLQAYLNLWEETDDEAFAQKAVERLDIDSALRFTVLLQSICMSDSVFNNMYIWAHHTQDGVRYRFMPWDLDATWGIDSGVEHNRWITYPIGDRLINLDIEDSRARLLEIWEEMRDKAFNLDTVTGLLSQYEHELAASGAFARNAARWETNHAYPDSYPILTYATVRFEKLDEVMHRIAQTEGKIDFLTDLDYLDVKLNVKFEEEVLVY